MISKQDQKHSMMLKAAVLAVCLLLAGVRAYDGPSYGVKLCGREFIRAVIFTCGGSRWKRSIMSTDDLSIDLFGSDIRDAAEGLVLPSPQKFSLQDDNEPVPFLEMVRGRQVASEFNRPARSIISDEVLEALRTSSRKGRDVVVGLSNACCKWGCSKNPPPFCLVPFHDDKRNIHCNWTWSLNPLIPTNFTLHWRDLAENGYNGDKDVGESDSGIISRSEYPAHEYIKVWVSGVNALGELSSEILVINTQNIMQPASPLISSHNSEPLEILWEVPVEGDHSGAWECKVQYKKQCDQDWTEVEDTYEVGFILEDAVPFTIYRFRVRCRRASEESSVMSEWSPEYTAETPVAAPVGTLDVWSECDSSSDESSCTILWKEMPKQQARGNINSYVLTMKLSNGSVLNINGSVYTSAEIYTQCEQGTITKEPLNLVSPAQQIYLRCSQEQEQSCFHYCHLSIPVKEVKCIGVTVNTAGGKSSPALVALPRTGQLSDYTAYNVSLFAIVNNRSCFLKSALGYTVEGVPPSVTQFQAIPTSPFSVNLTWTPIPLNMSRGHIMHYLVGISNYVSENITNIVVIVVLAVILLVLLIVLVCSKSKISKWINIPDPINSSSFKQLSNQFWQSWPVPSAPVEYGLTISQVEIVPEPEIHHEPEVEQPEEHREQDQSREKELQGYGELEQNNSLLRRQKEYSQMIDSSDEEWNEEPYPSDYEKHFLPCIVGV
ncbi:hypothetical protein QTP86_022564 [Hemibagrus guttatus]|nr:hypothetical protein QTP86_022564 [Hemibagrus guttatus]